MAAIISQMAANKRARQKGRKHIIPPDKCVYTLPPFDPCFDPIVHNKYVKAMNCGKGTVEVPDFLVFFYLKDP